MHRDVIQEHIDRIEHEIRNYKEADTYDDIPILLRCTFIDIDHQREQLITLVADLVRVGYLEQSLRDELATSISLALDDNRNVDELITRIANIFKNDGEDGDEDGEDKDGQGNPEED